MAITIAIAPVLAMTLVPARPSSEEPTRIPRGFGGPTPVELPYTAVKRGEKIRA